MRLEEINDIKTHVTTRISQAEDKLYLAKHCLDTHRWRDFASNLYYAVFNLCRAVINLDGKDTNTHKTLIGYFNYEYVHNRGMFSNDSIASKLNALFNTRGEADYETYFYYDIDNLNNRWLDANEIYSELLEYIEANLSNIKE